ncbi:hypothetical protein BMJ34_28525 [Sinorhizobium medicae]|nr:hypothetical protein BMJ34_28525 [Sinorhizobium medicae]
MLEHRGLSIIIAFLYTYLVEYFDTGPDGLKGMQALINEKAAQGHALHQAVPESTYQWVLIFSSLSCAQ